MTPSINVKVFGERNSGTNYVEAILRRQPEIRLLDGSASRYVGPLRSLVKRHLLGVQGDQPLDPDRLAPGREGAGGMLAAWVLRHRHLPQDVLWSAYYRLTDAQNFGWKHRRVVGQTLQQHRLFRSTRFVCLVRNPYAWLVSMRRRPYGMRLIPGSDWQTFLSHSWQPCSYDTSPTQRYDSVIDLWNRKVHGCVSFCGSYDNAILLRYEDFLENHEAATKRLAEFLGTGKHEGIDRSDASNSWAPINHSTKAGDAKTFAQYQSEYRDSHWMRDIPDETLASIQAALDQQLCRLLGYARENESVDRCQRTIRETLPRK
ncbi:MAG: sulfotransferase [Planctomycetales bacterium]|nr:sulfotransferase [Planctomycetales bacterium]